MDIKDIFAERLVKLREGNNITQQTLADDLGITRQSLSLYEKADRTINIYLLHKIAKRFNVSTDYLLGLQEAPTNNPDVIKSTEYTKLSKEAIEKLHQIGVKNCSTANSDTLSVLIEDLDFEYFLALLSAKMCADNNLVETVEATIGKAKIKVPVNALNNYEIERIISEISSRMKNEFLKRYKTVDKRLDVLFAVIVSFKKKQITEQEHDKLRAEFDKGNFDYVERYLKNMIKRDISNGNHNPTNK